MADKLLLCDLAQFLSAEPNLRADSVVVPTTTGRRVELFPPNFVTPDAWYDAGLENAYRRLRAAGLVSRAQLDAAHARHTRAALNRFDRPTRAEVAFLRSREPYCRALQQRALSLPAGATGTP